MMFSSQSRPRASSRFRGFSLLEMMVVLGLVGLILAMSAPALMVTRSVGLDTAARNAGAFFELGRSRAVTMGRPVRILIHDAADGSGHYRQKLIRVMGTGDGSWQVEGNPLLLPPDVVFDSKWPDSTNLRMEFSPNSGTPHSWLYYEIGGDGSVGKTGRNFVIASGEISEGVVSVPDTNAVRGFRISRNARLLYFREAGDIREVLR